LDIATESYRNSINPGFSIWQKIRHARAGWNPAITNIPRSGQSHKLSRQAVIIQASGFPRGNDCPNGKSRLIILLQF
jgi:hypothetical protein